MKVKKDINEDEIKKRLTKEQYLVSRQGKTEEPFNNRYYNNHQDGMYYCIVCHQQLFDSTTKFDSGSGWPSFANPVNLKHIDLVEDNSHGMQRIEVKCANCGSHLGHLFGDGPSNMGGNRYCINSSSLNFKTGNE